ncbi:hypothetical protein M0R72_05370 [Candidatus Pacearchaeota archaeon]|jgi:hypothetical protein|nr:hypothetical protein [Candidatus Pacearchaeota archaeon]
MSSKAFEKNIEAKVGMPIEEIMAQPFDETRVYQEKRYADFTGRILPQKKGKVLMTDGRYVQI